MEWQNQPMQNPQEQPGQNDAGNRPVEPNVTGQIPPQKPEAPAPAYSEPPVQVPPTGYSSANQAGPGGYPPAGNYPPPAGNYPPSAGGQAPYGAPWAGYPQPGQMPPVGRPQQGPGWNPAFYYPAGNGPYSYPAGGYPGGQPMPTPDPTTPVMKLAGQRLSLRQYRRLCRQNEGLKWAVKIIYWLLLLLFGLSQIFENSQYGDSLALGLAIGITALAELVFLGWMIFSPLRRKKAIDNMYFCAHAAEDGTTLTELYINRAEILSVRGKDVIPYHTALLWEYPDMLVLQSGGCAQVFRAEDLTPEQYAAFAWLVIPRLRPGGRRFRAAFVPRRYTPLPLPEIRNQDQVYMAFRVEKDQRRPLKRFFKKVGGALLPVLSAFSIGALAMANQIAYTKSLAVDIGINLALFWAAGLLVTVLTAAIAQAIEEGAIKRIDPSAFYAFTRDGVARSWGGGTLFIPAGFLSVKFYKKRMLLKTPYGSFSIPLSAVPDKEALYAAVAQYSFAKKEPSVLYGTEK